MKLITKFKYNWLDNFSRYIMNYRILSELRHFKWSWFKYWWLITILNKYETVRLESKKRILVLLLLRKYKSENIILITEVATFTKLYKKVNVDILQSLKTKLNNFRALGYTIVEATFLSWNTDNINFFTRELDFEEDEEKTLSNKFNNIQDTITIVKKLR